LSVVVGVSGNTIYYSTQDIPTHWLTLFKGLNTPNQTFQFAVGNNIIYMTGSALTDPIYQFDVAKSSFAPLFLVGGSTLTAYIYAKYLLWENGYLLAANVRDVRNLPASTTYYDDRVYYSFLLKPSSMTVDRFLNVSPGDGQFISGLTSKRSNSIGTRIVEVYKNESVNAVSFTELNPIAEGGDQKITQVAQGFGNISDNPPANIGAWDFFLDRSGIVQFDGGMLFRSSLEAERSIISNNIKPIIDKIVSKKTYKTALLKYYPLKNTLVFAYEDPNKYPKGVLNSVIFYDIPTGEWWPQDGWVVGSLETDNGPRGTGWLYYGDGMDGYVHQTENPTLADDSRLELSLDAMERTNEWVGASISTNIVAVGTASLSFTLSPSVEFSSITKVKILPFGEFYDKTESSATDKLSFKVWPSSLGYLSVLRVDLEINDVNDKFDAFFSSVVLSSTSLTAGSSAWTTIEIALSSFIIPNDWVDLSSETLPFARNSTRFGIRFAATATADLTLYFDDLRIVQGRKNPLSPFRLTKNMNLSTFADKKFYEIVLLRDKPRDSGFLVDVFTKNGRLSNTISIAKDVPKELFICGLSSEPGFMGVNSSDFSITKGTVSSNKSVFDFVTVAADPWNIYAFDYFNNRLVKIDRSSPTVFLSTYGSIGAGATQFNYIQEIALDSKEDGILMLIDHMNHRVKTHNKTDLSFISQYGQLGFGTTSFYNPTGLDFNDDVVVVGDDGNQRIVKFDRDFNYKTETKIDLNTIGNISLKMDERYLYDAYTKGSDDAVFYFDVILEKRNLSDLSPVNRVILRPIARPVVSSDTLRGSIALVGPYIFVSFNDNIAAKGQFYIQKLLRSDLSLVEELASDKSHSGLAGDNLARESSTKSEKVKLNAENTDFVQFRFYSQKENDSPFKIMSWAPVVEKLNYTVSP